MIMKDGFCHSKKKFFRHILISIQGDIFALNYYISSKEVLISESLTTELVEQVAKLPTRRFSYESHPTMCYTGPHVR